MSKLKITGVTLKHFNCGRNGAGPSVASAHFEGDITPEIKTEMNWDLGAGIPGGNLDGDIIGPAEIVPSKQALKDARLAFESLNLSGFKFATVKTKDGSQVKLKFNAKTAEELAGASFESYLNSVGEEPGYLKIDYAHRSRQQEQLDLEGEEEAEEEEQAEEAEA